MNEVALAVQFDSLPIGVLDIGTIRTHFSDAYPGVEQHPPKPPLQVEPQPVPSLQFEIVDEPDVPNFWFVGEEGTTLVQFQRDRLVVNWRKLEGTEYPRYHKTVRPMFVDAWRRLEGALDEIGGLMLTPNACELLYTNPIESDEGGWTDHGDIARVIAPWSGHGSDDYLGPPIDLRLAARYPLQGHAGSYLLVEMAPARRTSDNVPVILLNFAARGMPTSPDLQSVLEFMDAGHIGIVRGFTSFTTAEMHDVWGRLPDE